MDNVILTVLAAAVTLLAIAGWYTSRALTILIRRVETLDKRTRGEFRYSKRTVESYPQDQP